EAVNVADGTLLMPPEKVVDETDWDPDAKPGAMPDKMPREIFQERPEDVSRGSMQDASTNEMDRIRAQLEKLL
ncbi:MAG: hypothetical protein AAFP03_18835, partial [Cyanobacteria bacterium J06598_3]